MPKTSTEQKQAIFPSKEDTQTKIAMFPVTLEPRAPLHQIQWALLVSYSYITELPKLQSPVGTQHNLHERKMESLIFVMKFMTLWINYTQLYQTDVLWVYNMIQTKEKVSEWVLSKYLQVSHIKAWMKIWFYNTGGELTNI